MTYRYDIEGSEFYCPYRLAEYLGINARMITRKTKEGKFTIKGFDIKSTLVPSYKFGGLYYYKYIDAFNNLGGLACKKYKIEYKDKIIKKDIFKSQESFDNARYITKKGYIYKLSKKGALIGTMSIENYRKMIKK
jgi:hypothetical protein